MANTLEYTLSLKDQMSKSLQKIGVNSDSALNKFAALEKQSKQVRQAFKGMGTSVFTLKQKIDLLQAERDILPQGSIKSIRQYNKEIDKLEKKVTKLQTTSSGKISTMFKDAFRSLPAFATNPAILVGAGFGAAIKKGIQQDLQMTNLTTMLRGDAQKAKKLFGKITDFSIKTPYSKRDLVDAQSMMMRFGIASEKSFESLGQIGDIAMGDAEKMKSLTLAFSQATSTGKLMGQDLLQMINAGFNPLQVISQKTGESMASLKEKMSKGQISADQLSQAFKWATAEGGLFYKGAEKASLTLGGKLSTLMDKISEMALKVYDFIKPVLLPAVDMLIAGFGFLGDILVNVSAFASDYKVALLSLGGAIAGVTFLVNAQKWAQKAQLMWTTWGITRERLMNGVLKVKTLWLGIVAGATWLWNTAQGALNTTMLKNPLTWIIGGIALLAAGVIYLVSKIGGWKEAWSHALKAMKLKWQIFKGAIKLGFTAFSNAFLRVIDKIKLAWYRLKAAFGSDSAKASIERIKAQSKARMDAYRKEHQAQKDKLKELSGNYIKEKVAARNSLYWKKSDQKKKTPFGIADPAMPGSEEANAATMSGGANEGSSIDRATRQISTGGSRQTTVNLSIEKMVESLNIQKAGFKESVEDMRAMITDEFLRVLNTAQTIAS